MCQLKKKLSKKKFGIVFCSLGERVLEEGVIS